MRQTLEKPQYFVHFLVGLLIFISTAILANSDEKSNQPKKSAFDIELLQELNLETQFNQDNLSTSKNLSPLQLSPGTIYSFSQNDFRRYGWRSLSDVLRFFPSVFVYDPGLFLYGGQRGFVSNFSQTLLLVNGRELNNIVALEAFISRQYTLHNVERIEVVPGPISSLYGANALAGVIHIITKDHNPDYEGLNLGIEAAEHDRHALDLTFAYKISADWKVTGNGRLYQGDGKNFNQFVQGPDGVLEGWEQLSLALPHQSAFAENDKATNWQLTLFAHSFYAGVQQIRNQSGSGFASANRWLWDDSEDNRQQDWWFVGYQNKIRKNLNFKFEVQRLESSFWGQYHSAFWPVSRLETADGISLFELPQQVTTSTGETLNGEAQIRAFYASFPHYLIDQGILDPATISRAEMETYFTHIYSNKNARPSTRERIEGQLDWDLGENKSLTLGFQTTDTYYTGLAVTDAATGIGATFDVPLDENKRKSVYDSDKYGVFLQHKTPLFSDYFLTTGVRYDKQNHYGSSISPRISIAWLPNQQRSLKLTYGEAFREPNVFELASDNSIKPAELSAFEFNWIEPINDDNKLNLTLYHNKVSDFLSSVGALIGTGTGSVESQTVQGVEFQISGNYNRIDYFSGGNWLIETKQDIKELDGGFRTQDVLGLPKQRLFAGINYRFNYQYDLSLLYEWTAAYDALPGNNNLSEELHISDARQLDLVLNSKWLQFDQFTLYFSLGIKNLLDEKNIQANIRRSGANYFPLEGREISARLEFVF